MTGRDFWYGREVEGRLTDIQSVFIRRKIPHDAMKYPHIYFTWEPFSKKNDIFCEFIRKALREGKTVSIEINDKTISNIPLDIYNMCHLLYRLPAKNALKLKQTDTICLDMEPFQVLTASKYNFQETKRETYIFDSEKSTL